MTRNLQFDMYMRNSLHVRQRKTNQNKRDYIPYTRRRCDLHNILVSMYGNANSGKAYYDVFNNRKYIQFRDSTYLRSSLSHWKFWMKSGNEFMLNRRIDNLDAC